MVTMIVGGLLVTPVPAAPPRSDALGDIREKLDQFLVAVGNSTVPPWDRTLPSSTRFVVLSDMEGEAVLDRETGIVWQASLLGSTVWGGARHSCANSAVGNKKGWRLPSFAELASLIDPSVPIPGPKLPPGHPFTNVQSGPYWSASTNAVNPANAWLVDFGNGGVTTTAKTETLLVWCVRGGMNADEY
jgi:hypothetical protein